MFSKNPERLRFTEALVGLIFEPIGTARALLPARKFSVLLGIVAIFFLVSFGPLFLAEVLDAQPMRGVPTLITLMIVVIVAFVCFVILETLLLTLLGASPVFGEVFAISVFALVPASVCAILIFATDYLSNGNLRSAFFLTRGEQWFSNNFGVVLQYLLVGTQVITAFSFFCYIRVLASMGIINALFTTAISIFPLYLSIAGGALFGRLICPTCVERFFSMITSFLGKSKLPW